MWFDVILPLLFLAVLGAFFYVFYVEMKKDSVARIRMINEFYMYAKNKNNEIKEKKENV